MAVGEFNWPNVKPIEGVRLSAVKAGVKYQDRYDLALIEIEDGSSVSGVFTRNAFCAEPIKICRKHLQSVKPRYLLINSGNANACTGQEGYAAAIATCEAIANEAGIEATQVLPFSTGVIGEVLPAAKIVRSVPAALESLSENNWHLAAQAIMTTDTREKGWSEEIELSGSKVTISGIAKGAGMIKPNMGTMLAYVATDANVSQEVLDTVIHKVANKSFNRITVDGDTSTNDALIAIATAKANNVRVENHDSEDAQILELALTRVCQRLALEMVRDAEGATKCVEVNVKGGARAQDSLDVAYAICHSPLVKTAMFASDPNWGRIVAAIGYSGVENLDPSKINVSLDDVSIVENGGRAKSYQEEKGQAVFDKAEFTISVDLGMGDCEETLWTSDLNHDYVKINAEYRT